MRTFCLTIFVLLASPLSAQKSDELNFVSGIDQFDDIRHQLPEYLKRSANDLLHQREQKVANLATLEDVARRKEHLREGIDAEPGRFSERTPLNPKVTGVHRSRRLQDRENHFRKPPKFYVTANLYVPKTGRPPYPAILYPLGHELGAKSHNTWQQMLGSLATKGYVALAWDPSARASAFRFMTRTSTIRKSGRQPPSTPSRAFNAC